MKKRIIKEAFEYECPHCGKILSGSFGDMVYCPACDKTYETDWDYITDDNLQAWLTGTEYSGNMINEFIIKLKQVIKEELSDMYHDASGFDQVKIYGSYWFTQMGDPNTIGVVAADTGAQEGIKCYIGTGLGHDEKYDEKYIALTGGIFPIAAGRILFPNVKFK